MRKTPLCNLAYKYGTDKCPQYKHGYTPYYYDLLKDRRDSIKKVLEIGIGYYEHIKFGKHNWGKDPKIKRKYHKGASLKMWRDFLPNAHVYGADIKDECMLGFEDRITTYICDERKQSSVFNLIKQTGPDIDLFIDDGSHLTRNQIRLAEFALPLLDDGVIYVIEDVEKVSEVSSIFSDYYDVEIPILKNERDFTDDNLVVIRK